MYGAVTIGRARRPFPRPILDAVRLIKEERGTSRWLEWRSPNGKMELCLVTLGERKSGQRRLWSTWEKTDAAGMETCLRKIGVEVQAGREYALDMFNGETMQLWFVPE